MARFLLLITIGCFVIYPCIAESEIDNDISSSESTELDYQYPQNSTLLQKLRVRRQCCNRGSYCQPNRIYCGNELRDLGYSNTNGQTLYRCERNYEGSYLATCSNGCHPNNGAAHCHCQAGGAYCGYQLRRMNFPFAVEEHELYQCTEMHQISRYQSCDMGCQSNSHASGRCTSVPPSQCTIGREYCGYELTPLGYDYAIPQALYLCQQNTGHLPQFAVERGRWPKVASQGQAIMNCIDDNSNQEPCEGIRSYEPPNYNNIGTFRHICASGCHHAPNGRSYCGSGYVARPGPQRYAAQSSNTNYNAQSSWAPWNDQ